MPPLELYEIEEFAQVLAAGVLLIAKITEVRHASRGQKAAEAVSRVRLRLEGTVKFHESLEREGINHELNITSAQISDLLTGKKLVFRARDVDVADLFHTEQVDSLLSFRDLP